MIGVYALIYIPILLFVVGFLFETYLSFRRLFKVQTHGYVDATWEVTHTLLIFGVVMLLMLYSQVIDQLATEIFLSTFLAAVVLGVRGACYIYLFFIRQNTIISWVDWAFAISHVLAALLLVITVLQATIFIATTSGPVNTHFILPFMPGLLLVALICAIPIYRLYKHPIT